MFIPNSARSQDYILLLARRVALFHKTLVFAVVAGIILTPFASVEFRTLYTIFFIVVAIVPILNGGKCPLTQLEKRLLKQGGQEPYEGSCIPHYLPFVTPFQVYIGKGLICIILFGVWTFT